MDLLARREHSTSELRRKLHGRGFDRQAVDCVLEELVQDRLIDDSRFVESYVSGRAERGFGPRRIRAELRERGVDDAVIAELLDMRDESWGQHAVQARTKRYGEGVPREPRERAKQMRFLEYRGFTPDQIRGALAGGDWDE